MIRNFRVTSNADNQYVRFVTQGSVDNLNIRCRHIVDGWEDDWQDYSIGDILQFNAGESWEFVNDSGSFSSGRWDYVQLDVYGDSEKGEFDVSGNIGSLLWGEYDPDQDDQQRTCPGQAFYQFFYNSGVVDASRLLLKFDRVEGYSFQRTFGECEKLKAGPAIGDYEYVEDYAFAQFFENCHSLQHVDWMLTSNGYARQYYCFYQFLDGSGVDNAKLVTYSTEQDTSQLDLPYNWSVKLVDFLTIRPDDGNESFYIDDISFNEIGDGAEYYTKAAGGWTKIEGNIPVNGQEFVLIRSGSSNLAFTGPQISQSYRISGKLYTCWNWKFNEGDEYYEQMNFSDMFAYCNELKDASELEFQESPYTNYVRMFQNSGIQQPPRILPTEIGQSSMFQFMFQNCTSLMTAPELPATNILSFAYQGMFSGCTSLATAPVLPATDLQNYCYQSMFSGCTSLATAPALPATTLTERCYSYMFSGCTSLATAPVLPATNLANYCYEFMFQKCTSLTTAPELPATNLKQRCYTNMFEECWSLTKAPDLPAETVPDGAYNGMFQVCTSLVDGPSINAKAFTGSNNMFAMFHKCSNLKSITWTGSAFRSYTYFTNQVSSTGTFYYTDKNLDVASIPRSNSGIPPGWTIKYLSPKPSLVFYLNGRAVASLMINGKAVAKLN